MLQVTTKVLLFPLNGKVKHKAASKQREKLRKIFEGLREATKKFSSALVSPSDCINYALPV
jgi:hypothetical protein